MRRRRRIGADEIEDERGPAAPRIVSTGAAAEQQDQQVEDEMDEARMDQGRGERRQPDRRQRLVAATAPPTRAGMKPPHDRRKSPPGRAAASDRARRARVARARWRASARGAAASSPGGRIVRRSAQMNSIFSIE